MPNAWKHQEKLKEQRNLPTPEEMRAEIYSIKNERDRFFVALAYLTGGRVSELLDIRKEDISVTEKKGIKVLLIQMKNEKNKKRNMKLLPIRMDLEGPLANIILDYISGREGRLLGFRSRQRGWQIFMKYTGFNPHFARHLRATHLVIYRGFSDQKLKLYLGWSDSRPADTYIHLRWEDLL
jgi:integrase